MNANIADTKQSEVGAVECSKDYLAVHGVECHKTLSLGCQAVAGILLGSRVLQIIIIDTITTLISF